MDTVSVAFTGDIGFDRYMAGRWEDGELLCPEILAFLRGADHTVANVEGAVIRARDDGSRGVFFHSMDPAAVTVLERIHGDIWSIGNNHTMDAGAEGVASTMAQARSRGWRTFGAGPDLEEASRPLYLEGAGGIGMIGVSYMAECIPATERSAGIFRWDDMERIARRIGQIRARCRWCVVVAHGGEEFTPLPSPYTRERYRAYLAMGADAVVAHHPHVPESYELMPDGKAIFYSLGNFIFDTDYQRAHRYTDRGVLLKLIFTPQQMRFEAMGLTLDRERERIGAAALPEIFAPLSPGEYDRLAPLAAAAFLSEEKRKMVYLEPERFAHAAEGQWESYFLSEEPDGYFPGAHMDLSLILPLARRAAAGEWRGAGPEAVRNYILSLVSDEFL